MRNLYSGVIESANVKMGKKFQEQFDYTSLIVTRH